jgi:predicted nucleic acid-binding protein
VRRFFLDANVIFTAAHNPGGNGRALFRLAAERQLELVSSRYALEEAARNIAVKFPECVGEFNSLIASLRLVAEPSQAEIQVAAARRLPDKDVPILAAAIAARASALVTGDRRDFGHLYGTTIEGVGVLTPAEAVSKALSSRVAK